MAGGTVRRATRTTRGAGGAQSVGRRAHALAALAGLSSDEYHELLGRLFDGCTSSSALSPAEQRRWVDHLQHLADIARGRKSNAPALSPKQRLMWSLWQQLADAGLVQQRSMSALESYVERQTGVAKLAWLNGAQEDTVIESAKRWLKRGA